MGEVVGHLPSQKKGSAENEHREMLTLWESRDAQSWCECEWSAGDGEDLQQLSRLAASLWSRSRTFAFSKKGSAENEHRVMLILWESRDAQCCCACG